MFNYWKKIDAQNQLVKAQWVFISILTVIALSFYAGWMKSSKEMTVYVPPSMIAQGGFVKPGEIPNEEIYSLAFQIFSAVNVWHEDGEKDYLNNIQRYQNFLTPRFREQLLANYQERKQTGEAKRIRTMSIYQGYESDDVQSLGAGVWDVHLMMRLTERLDAASIVSKDVLMDYTLRVVHTNISRAKNPVGLMLDGYAKPEKRIKSFV